MYNYILLILIIVIISFTAQLQEIRKVTLSRLLCDNTNVDAVQLVTFVKPAQWYVIHVRFIYIYENVENTCKLTQYTFFQNSIQCC